MSSDVLPDDPETLKAMLLAERVQNDRLRQIIKELQRHRFGRRAETLPEDQMLLGLEDVEQTEADRAAKTDGSSPKDRQARAHKRRINCGALPGHLPRIEIVVDINNKTCPCCQGELHRIAKTGVNGWISCRRSSGCSSPGGPNMPAGLARTVSYRLRHQRAS
jgi:transposase